MNPHKHMEAIFGAVAVTALLIAALPDNAARAAAHTAPSTATPSATPSDITGAIPNPAAASSNTAEQAIIHGAGVMPVVVIKGKRLSAREKRRLALARA
jgi:ADP-ribosylglycohydrolase